MRPRPALLLAGLTVVAANTEKAIFLGPSPNTIHIARPIEVERIDTLTPSNNRLRTHLEASFPTAEIPRGTATWFLLDRLAPGRRYEARVCWTATQPTAFTLTTHELDAVLADPGLAASLRTYSHSKETRARARGRADQDVAGPREQQEKEGDGDGDGDGASALLLRVLAAADYFAANATLMERVDPVHVDLILDPFLVNFLPRSLAPTAVYIVAVAIVSYLAALSVAAWLSGLAAETAYASGSASTSDDDKKRQ